MNDYPLKNRTPDILIVDDEPGNLQVLTEILKKRGYKVRPVSRGSMALQAAKNELPDLILLDINMPDMSGYEVCIRLKKDELLKNIPVIFISALNQCIDKVKAFSAGGVDYIEKPFHFEEVQSRVETHLKLHFLQIELEKYNQKLEELVQAQVEEITESHLATIFALAKLAESRDDDTGKHLERVQSYCWLLSEKLREKPLYQSEINHYFIKNMVHASPLHDIGKVSVPDAILLKPGKLDRVEFEIIKKHTTIGAENLNFVYQNYPNNSIIKTGIEIARYHHEKWDGGGYPEGLSGNNIPLCARIMTVADVYDALRSKRIYKPAFSHEESCEIILKDSGIRFDPGIAEVFRENQDQLKSTSDKLGE